MDGIDVMSKAELVIECEKYKIEGLKTVAQMKYALKKYFEEHDDALDKKKAKPDPTGAASLSSSSTSGTTPGAAKPGVCPKGAACPDLHSMAHRLALAHDGFRPNPIKCRDGMGCQKLHDKEHLIKYAHEDDVAKVCKDGADCAKLHLMDHRKQYEHPGFRAEPVACRDGMTCAQLTCRKHLYKYAHVDTVATPLSPALSTTLAVAASSSSSVTAASASDTTLPAAAPSVAESPKKAAEASTPSAITATSLADVPLELATDPELVDIPKDSEEFWDLEEKFAANMQGRNEDYVEKRIKAGKKPLRFVLIGAQKIKHPILEQRFELKKAELAKIRDSKELRERWSFHGTHPKNIKSILKYGLLPFQHPLNPCKTQVDTGYFGSNRKGVYTSRYIEYTLKYSNRVVPVDPGDEVKTIMFRTLPGRSKHIEKLCGPIDPTPGYDSHSSPTFLEWFLFDSAQTCPLYILTARAAEDTRTAADDE